MKCYPINMLERPKRLTKKRDFLRLATKGRSAFGPYATLRVVETPKGAPGKIGFITSTKIFKHAVDRNRTKRRLREVVRSLLPTIPPGIHVLFVAKPEAKDADYQKLTEEIARLISKIPEVMKQPARPSSRGVKHQQRKKLATAPTPKK